MKWTTIALPTKREVRGVWCDGRGLVLVRGAGMFRSTDHGVTWATITLPVQSWVLGVYGSATSLFAVSGGGVLIGSTDGGVTWKKQKIPKGLPTGVCVAGDRVWVVGHAGY